MCTATDMAVLCGGNAEVCYSKYVVLVILDDLPGRVIDCMV